MKVLNSTIIYSTIVIFLGVIVFVSVNGKEGAETFADGSDLLSPEVKIKASTSDSITVIWLPVNGVDEYNFYIAKESGVSPQTYSLLNGGKAILNVESPFKYKVDEDGMDYFVVVSAVHGKLESPSNTEQTPVSVAFQSRSDSLRLYKSGDYIEYSVMGSRKTDNDPEQHLTGMLRLEYSGTELPSELSGTEFDSVLRELTTLTIDGSTELTKVTSYIRQDESGALRRLAIEDSNGNLMMLKDSEVNKSKSANWAPVQIESPLPESGTHLIEFNLMSDCNFEYDCKRVSLSSSGMMEYLGREVIETVAGYFAARIVTVDRIYNQESPGVKPGLNYETLCGPEYTNSLSKIALFPEIGAVNINVDCHSGNGVNMTYSANFDNTNIRWRIE